MYVAALELADFRSYPTVNLRLEPGCTTFVGANGQGKTNLLEALGYAATLGSHRVSADAPMVRAGAERAVIRVGVVRGERKMLVELELVPGRANRARINRSPVRRPREVLGVLRTVLFAPEDLALVRGDPAERRRYLDELLVARTPRLAGVRADYDRVLKQRNMLLRTAAGRRGRSGSGGPGDMATLDSWDVHLARHGAELLAARLRLVAELGPLIDKSYEQVSGGHGPVEARYVGSVGELPRDENIESPDDQSATDVLARALLAELARLRPQEVERGLTLAGPHRDELVLSLGELPARGYASQGESWSLALAMRLASYELLRSDGMEPVLLLDDVFAELDATRRDRLAKLLAPAEQVLITAAVVQDVPDELQGRTLSVGSDMVSANPWPAEETEGVDADG
jgi:DNA replication and repair protein RecF